MLPNVYVTVWEDFHNTAQMYSMKEGGTFIVAAAGAMSWRVETPCFIVKAKVLCLGFQKRTQLEISG